MYLVCVYFVCVLVLYQHFETYVRVDVFFKCVRLYLLCFYGRFVCLSASVAKGLWR